MGVSCAAVARNGPASLTVVWRQLHQLPQGGPVRLHRCVTVLAATAAVLTTASPARAAWQPVQRVNPDDPAVTDVGAAYVGTADDGSAVAVWLEWRGDDARLVASRRPVGGAWGPSQVVDDLTEKPGVTGGRADLTSMVVLPDGSALISYQEYDDDAEADFVGKVVTLHRGRIRCGGAQWSGASVGTRGRRGGGLAGDSPRVRRLRLRELHVVLRRRGGARVPGHVSRVRPALHAQS